MEIPEQRFVVKCFFFKSLDPKAIQRELTAVLDSMAYSLVQIKAWRVRFKSGNLPCEAKFRPGRPPHVVGKACSDFLEEFPFATRGIIAQYFNQSKSTIKEILQRELGLQRFSGRSIPRALPYAQKVDRTAMLTDLLSILYRQVDYSFFSYCDRGRLPVSLSISL
jgi:hypothetical protein